MIFSGAIPSLVFLTIYISHSFIHFSLYPFFWNKVSKSSGMNDCSHGQNLSSTAPTHGDAKDAKDEYVDVLAEDGPSITGRAFPLVVPDATLAATSVESHSSITATAPALKTFPPHSASSSTTGSRSNLVAPPNKTTGSGRASPVIVPSAEPSSVLPAPSLAIPTRVSTVTVTNMTNASVASVAVDNGFSSGPAGPSLPSSQRVLFIQGVSEGETTDSPDETKSKPVTGPRILAGTENVIGLNRREGHVVLELNGPLTEESVVGDDVEERTTQEDIKETPAGVTLESPSRARAQTLDSSMALHKRDIARQRKVNKWQSA